MTRLQCSTAWASAIAMSLGSGLLAGPVSAQSVGTPALSAINPAGGSCRRDDASSSTPGAVVPAPVLVEPDLGCAITAAEARRWQEAPDTLFVDTRLPAEHAQFGIRGAVNLAALDLRTKSYLKAKRIVLFGNGKAEQEVYRACAQLKQAGFSQVRVLRGGVGMWQLAQQPLVGSAIHNGVMVGLSAAEFWQEAMFDDNVVLVSPARREVQGSLSFSVLLDQPSGDAIRAVLERRRKELKGAPLASVVLVVGKEVTRDQLNQIRQSLDPIPILVYADSQEALIQQMTRQQAVWSAHARGPKKPACGT